jgi:hypothetical protein
MSRSVPASAFVVTVASVYGAFTILTLLGLFVHESLMMPGFFLWPYPMLLGLQKLVSPDSRVSWLVALILGYVVVLTPALTIERAFDKRGRQIPAPVRLGLLGVIVPLLAVTLLVAGVAAICGWPMGE